MTHRQAAVAGLVAPPPMWGSFGQETTWTERLFQVRSRGRLAALGATRRLTTGGYAFGRVFSGSNTAAATAATVTGKHSFMYSTCSAVPAAACSIGR